MNVTRLTDESDDIDQTEQTRGDMNGGLLRNRLRLWRVESGLTQDEVADLSGLSKAYISRMERGEREPRPLTKVKIARRLGVQVSDLFDVEQIEDVSV